MEAEGGRVGGRQRRTASFLDVERHGGGHQVGDGPIGGRHDVQRPHAALHRHAHQHLARRPPPRRLAAAVAGRRRRRPGAEARRCPPRADEQVGHRLGPLLLQLLLVLPLLLCPCAPVERRGPLPLPAAAAAATGAAALVAVLRRRGKRRHRLLASSERRGDQTVAEGGSRSVAAGGRRGGQCEAEHGVVGARRGGDVLHHAQEGAGGFRVRRGGTRKSRGVREEATNNEAASDLSSAKALIF
ncbi:hypothetical protein HU200_027132 [Digitaria exilis]|uniref:Uncharacterized protein n=1 Tax=Digitaria exilis TaxID=1010633 RepID=A0A835BUX2_9POAL|nr:hypothetical protein HU200_027132 [Digitaria exilis]